MAYLKTISYQRQYLDYNALTEKFKEFMLQSRYSSIKPKLESALNSHYFGKLVETPDKKFIFFMDLTYIYTFPFTSKEIEVIDMENKIVYALDKRRTYKKFKAAALYALNSVT